jgi:hypothetical protein
MAGTKEGGAKASATNRLKHGEDFYKRIGAIGGATQTDKPKGFAQNNHPWWKKITLQPSRAALAGKKGGTISRRGPSTRATA